MKGFTDREELEWLIYFCLKSENALITFSRARELLGFTYAEEFREWINDYLNNGIKKYEEKRSKIYQQQINSKYRKINDRI